MFYDVIILGNNLDAQRTALTLARAGISVAVIADEMEGSRLQASDLNRWLELTDIPDDWADAFRMFQQETKQIRHANLHWFKSFGIDLVKGTARFVDTESILVSGFDGDTLLHATQFVIASDESTDAINNGSINCRFLITPDQLANGAKLPKKIAIVYDDRSQHGRWGGLSRYTNVVSQLAGWKQIISITESSSKRLIVKTRQQGVFVVEAILVDRPNGQTDGLRLNGIGVGTSETGHITTGDNFVSTVDRIFAIGNVARFKNRAPDGDHVAMLVDRILNPTTSEMSSVVDQFTEDDFHGLRLVTG